MRTNQQHPSVDGSRGSARRLFAVLLSLSLAACGGTPSPQGDFEANQALLKTCDPADPPASLVEIDASGSSSSDALAAERFTAVEAVARRTTVCGGRLRVLAFSASSTDTIVLFDEVLEQHGATDNARLKRVPEAVTSVMTKVRDSYDAAVKQLPRAGSDVTAEYRLAAEWMAQLGGAFRLNLVVLSDGFQNVGVDLVARPLNKQEAEALAGQVTLPKLPGASVTVAGLGRVAGERPSSSIVEGLVSFYDALCHRTEASKCLSVSDYAVESH
jgi:hypothetical protein